MSKDKFESHVDKEKKWGPVTDLSVYKDVVLPPDVEAAKERFYREHLEPYKLNIPAFAMKQIYEAALTDDMAKRSSHLKRAYESMHTCYLHAWSKGKIKVHDETAPPMPEEVKQQLRELNKQKREAAKAEREERDARKQEIDRAEGKTATPKRSKIPVFQDPDQQKLVLNKYPWVVPGSFKQDAEKAGGTNVDIRCACGKTRTIHLADAFQVKKCTGCRGK